jgi:CRP-like cAMP-binding protein
MAYAGWRKPTSQFRDRISMGNVPPSDLLSMETEMLVQTARRTPTTNAIAAAVAERSPRDVSVAALQSIGSVCQFGRNQTIFSDGDIATYSYKLVNGAVRLVKLMPDGRRHIAGFRLAGDLFGIEWTNEYNLSAEAVSDVTAVRYARSHLERLGEERADVRKQITDRLRSDLCDAHEHLISLGCQSAKERVASFLQLLARRAAPTEGAVVYLPMGRQDIADYLGLTIETVCRILSDLKEARVIQIPNRHQIVVMSKNKLDAAANADCDA